jgi:hypothetical protein
MNSHSKNLAAAFRKAGTELSRSSMLPFLKLTEDGEWVAGAENAPVTGTRFAVDAQGAQRGFSRFANGTVEDVMVPVGLCKEVSHDDLPVPGPLEEGWRASASFPLRSLETGEELIFKTTSQGGLSALGDVLNLYADRLEAGKGGRPVIQLAVTWYNHKRFGRKCKPRFPIVGWVDEGDPNATPITPSSDLQCPTS